MRGNFLYNLQYLGFREQIVSAEKERFVAGLTVRQFYTVVCAVVAIVAVLAKNSLVSGDTIDGTLSYVATVATLLGVIVAIGEVRHALSVAESVRARIDEAMTRHKELEYTARKAECLALLDQMDESVKAFQYDRGHGQFLAFRSLRRASRNGPNFEMEQTTWDCIEQLLSDGRHTSPSTPPPVAERRTLRLQTSELKRLIERESFKV